jgi:hypothetical protein
MSNPLLGVWVNSLPLIINPEKEWKKLKMCDVLQKGPTEQNLKIHIFKICKNWHAKRTNQNSTIFWIVDEIKENIPYDLLNFFKTFIKDEIEIQIFNHD